VSAPEAESGAPATATEDPATEVSTAAQDVAPAVAPNTVERVLVLAAHPDDIDFGAAATIAAWTAAGIEVSYCLCTYGDAGGFDDTPRAQMPILREAEQRAAAAVVGVTDLEFLGYPDGALYVTHELRRDISRVIRRVRPQRMLIPSPERNWERIGASHPDHMAAGEAAICAIYPDARNPFAHPELLEAGYEAWSVGEVWLMADAHPDHYVDVTDTFEKKIEALRAHVTQTAHHPDLPGMIRGWLTAMGQAGGLPEGRLAEAFRIITIPI
jgi:LmbE family N-acetylglucosaminyl deacetylase